MYDTETVDKFSDHKYKVKTPGIDHNLYDEMLNYVLNKISEDLKKVKYGKFGRLIK